MLHWAAFVQFLASQWLALDIVQYIVRIGQAGLGRVALAALLAKPRQDMFLNGLCTLNSLLRVAEMLSAHFFPLVMFEPHLVRDLAARGVVREARGGGDGGCDHLI